ncbi:MAG: DEAD/DEAH box helicase [Chromatiales bacterium]|nr:DEAD/DEAH box helicase [Chromatiales bacterium]TVS10299.1 MAG: DEAD/DEAH box helicase [Gammaproteobacteria bacterium]
MTIRLSFDEDCVTLAFESRQSLVDRLLSRDPRGELEENRTLDFALADLRASAEEVGDEVEIAPNRIRMTHRTLSMLAAETASALGLPPLVDLTLRTDVTGLLGSPDFRLDYEWVRSGRRELVQRTGAILQTSGKQAGGLRRIPRWMLDTLNIADGFSSDSELGDHWASLAAFRRALDPGVDMDRKDPRARVALSDFLDGLEVKLADAFSISPKDDDRFDIIPFSSDSIDGIDLGGEPISEDAAELSSAPLAVFQDLVFSRGARPAYRLGGQSYLVVDPAAEPALRVMAGMKSNPDRSQRAAFIRNPRHAITEAYTEVLRQTGKLEGLAPAGEEEIIEEVAGPVFVETREYSNRVIGVKVYEAPSFDIRESTTTWLPEVFPETVIHTLQALPAEEIRSLIAKIDSARKTGADAIEYQGQAVPTTEASRAALVQRLLQLEPTGGASEGNEKPDTDGEQPGGPIILDHKSNLGQTLGYRSEIQPRVAMVPCALPSVIRTELKQHQIDSFKWMLEAWQAGLPGILNADEQGLGKTLQAIAFLAWVKEHWSARQPARGGPVLIVAPTSLLENWEHEVDKHLNPPGLGNVVRLYGSGIGARKPAGQRGYDTQSGNPILDFSDLHESISDGRGHRYWVLTTYTTLTNYQHSLGKIPFSTAVFDEIQALKNPGSLRAHAAAVVNADFRIGLTGTPIENSTVDLWAVMDQLNPGRLDTLPAFRARYGEAGSDNMQELFALMFNPRDNLPPVALRRLKEAVARDLPPKTRRLHPRLMPPIQSDEYEKARGKLMAGTRGSALKMLHHIRSVSVHPQSAASVSDQEYVAMSARLQASLEVLRHIHTQRERALVFIEHRQMQYRFIELVKREFGLASVDLINGQTPIAQRQKIVSRFQENLSQDAGFDILVLGPKAAGIGLTLTAATHVIHLSRWWNPAVEEQCNDRVHRIGQSRSVTVHIPMAIHPGYLHKSFDCLLHSLMAEKRRLARSALWPMGDTTYDVERLQQLLGDNETISSDDPVTTAIAGMFSRDGLPMPQRNPDGSIPYD